MITPALIFAVILGAAVGLFVWGVVRMAMSGWTSYEKKYVEGAEETLDSMFMTIPTRNLLYFSIGGALLGGGACFLITRIIILALAVAVFFFFLPKIIIGHMKKKRSQKFIQQMVDVLISMANSLKSGYSVPQAIGLISREMDNPVKQEFKLVAAEMQLGTPLEEAMDHLYQRMPSTEMELIVASMAISRSVGGNLSEILGNIASTLRERLRVEGRVKALTAQGKLQGIVMCAMPFFLAFVLYLVEPAFIEPVFTTPAGFAILGLIIVLEAIGIFIISRIVKVDV